MTIKSKTPFCLTTARSSPSIKDNQRYSINNPVSIWKQYGKSFWRRLLFYDPDSRQASFRRSISSLPKPTISVSNRSQGPPRWKKLKIRASLHPLSIFQRRNRPNTRPRRQRQTAMVPQACLPTRSDERHRTEIKNEIELPKIWASRSRWNQQQKN